MTSNVTIRGLVEMMALGPKGAGDFGVEQPLSFERNLGTFAYVRDGEWVFAGVFGAVGEDGRSDREFRSMVFVRAVIGRKGEILKGGSR